MGNNKDYTTATFSIAYTIYSAICQTLMGKRKYTEDECLKEIQNTIVENVIEHKLYRKYAKLTALQKLGKTGDYIESMIISIELFLWGKQIEGYDRVMESMKEELRITREMEEKKPCDNR